MKESTTMTTTSQTAENSRCSGCGTRDHRDDERCPNAPSPQPSGWDETTETADDVSWGAAYGDEGSF